MRYIPHEQLEINWIANDKSFMLSLPWLSIEVDVDDQNKEWIMDATKNLHFKPESKSVQNFIQNFKEYPIFYFEPRPLEDFKSKDLQTCLKLDVDPTTPTSLLDSFGCEIHSNLLQYIPQRWAWDRKKILSKSKIKGTDLYDPISFVSYLICYRLHWESTSWSGQNGFGKFLEALLKKDEQKFFKAIAWISKQSWYVTRESAHSMEPALVYFPKAKELISHFIADEVGHHKFIEQVFNDICFNKDDFPVAEGTRWFLASHKRAAAVSPLAFSAMINLFEAAYYEGQDPISRIIKLSSKPHAARGYDLHYKINQEHRHCDMPIYLAAMLAPQTQPHALLTLGLFELTLHILDEMEKSLANIVDMR